MDDQKLKSLFVGTMLLGIVVFAFSKVIRLLNFEESAQSTDVSNQIADLKKKIQQQQG